MPDQTPNKEEIDFQIFEAKRLNKEYCPICGYLFHEIRPVNYCYMCDTQSAPNELIDGDADYAWCI